MNKKFKIQKAFTLIELLVVVAVIAILAGVVLSSTSNSRARGANTGVKTNLRTVLQQSELYYLNNANTYGTITHSLGPCTQLAGTPFSDPVTWSAILETQKQTGGVMPTCVSTPNAYAVSAKFKTQDQTFTYWCIDSQGNAKGETSNITDVICN
ncbi:hypothetical protein COW91_02845 [Candidatus Nomurabacteria bacterium CG22_combo_CG10-13_8_21_14_all_32_8]|uniref:Type II secretion system protein GspG C-terminal domain-containing protein n=2 Tax=Candidatus Nomuraibacteriota TaxID=1752729 RepID=A0A2H0CG00_9BACT|nr:MAG: hypothetical protein COW91_02845 [Candidatus Nomurabacteria bacterium CG22_combo_CG10-13_8_21_14_all_32_8]PIZ85960.1 MAG: hypothetical protein COX94_01430 [Candidatus Nomurabacteria bacterium CG_4_10_14_0_2_um_filter_33_9]